MRRCAPPPGEQVGRLAQAADGSRPPVCQGPATPTHAQSPATPAGCGRPAAWQREVPAHTRQPLLTAPVSQTGASQAPVPMMTLAGCALSAQVCSLASSTGVAWGPGAERGAAGHWQGVAQREPHADTRIPGSNAVQPRLHPHPTARLAHGIPNQPQP